MFRAIRGKRPRVAESAFVDPTAVLTGDITLGEKTSVWANVTIRADIDSISVDDDSNIQDNSCLHVDWGDPLKIGKRVVVGHSCTVHGCEIGDDCLIGRGSTILSGWVPPYQGSHARRLAEAGAVLLGKLTMDEFGMGSSPENSAFGVYVHSPAVLIEAVPLAGSTVTE